MVASCALTWLLLPLAIRSPVEGQDPPTNLQAVANGDSAIDLSWTAPSVGFGEQIQGYKIESTSDTTMAWTVLRANTNSTATTFTHGGLPPDTTVKLPRYDGHLGGYEEWGVRGRIEISPRGDGGGLSLRLVPVWGEAASDVRELWERGVSGRPGQSHVMQRGRLNAELAYDLPAFHGTPYGRLQVTEGGGRTLGTGMRYEVKRILGLSLEGTRTGSTGGPPRHRLAVKGAWRFGPAKAATERNNDQDERD